MARILIVHAHPEPKSFSSALAHTARETLTAAGHEVTVSDLYALCFDPVADRRNFTTVADPAYYKQQGEELYATEHHGFTPALEAEIRKVEACDLLIFSFPLWWFGLPAILKGWVDRVFAFARIYGRGRWYEHGMGQGKRAMVLMTTGGGEAMYNGHGPNPELESMLSPIHHGMFWFNGYSPLPPFVAWSAAHGTDDDRRATLAKLRERLANVLIEPVRRLPPVGEFDSATCADKMPRFMVVVTLKQALPGETRSALKKRLNDLHLEGRVLSYQFATEEASLGGFLHLRDNPAHIESLCQALPGAESLAFTIVPLAPANSSPNEAA